MKLNKILLMSTIFAFTASIALAQDASVATSSPVVPAPYGIKAKIKENIEKRKEIKEKNANIRNEIKDKKEEMKDFRKEKMSEIKENRQEIRQDRKEKRAGKANAFLEAQTKKLNQRVLNVEKSKTRVEARIAKNLAKNIDVSAAQAIMAQVPAILDQAKASIASLTALTPADGATTTAKDLQNQAKPIIDSVQNNLKNANQLIIDANKKSDEALRANRRATTTGTTSTTTTN